LLKKAKYEEAAKLRDDEKRIEKELAIAKNNGKKRKQSN
jgi:ATP-dependent Clp protease ATP-binding subunit ClpC